MKGQIVRTKEERRTVESGHVSSVAGIIQLPGDKGLAPMGIDDMSAEHMANWFEWIRSRQQPIASLHDGFGHSVACIMAVELYWTGKKLYWDSAKEEILDRASQAM